MSKGDSVFSPQEERRALRPTDREAPRTGLRRDVVWGTRKPARANLISVDEREARRHRRRRELVIRRFELGKEPSDDISGTTTAAERLAMMWPLALRAWSLTGEPLPSYSRAEIPSRIIRGPR